MTRGVHSAAIAFVHVPFAIVLAWLAYRRFCQGRTMPRIVAIPFAGFRVLALIGLATMLAGCADSEPLAVASGPVFQLNPGHWLPSKEALAAPPVVVAN